MTHSEIRSELRSLTDAKYNTFNARIVRSSLPTLGVRIPALRALSVRVARDGASEFLQSYKVLSYEDLSLRGFVIGQLRDVGLGLSETWRQVQMLDSWATCDTFCSSLRWLVRHARCEVTALIDRALAADGEFVRRWGIVMRMTHFLDNEADAAVTLAQLQTVRSGEYYVNMGVAWALATALAKAEALTLPLLLNRDLWPADIWKKAIQKSLESFRISADLKDLLRHMRADARS